MTQEMISQLDCFKKRQQWVKGELLKAFAKPDAGKTKEVVEGYRNLRDDIKGILSERVRWDGMMTEKMWDDGGKDSFGTFLKTAKI